MRMVDVAGHDHPDEGTQKETSGAGKSKDGDGASTDEDHIESSQRSASSETAEEGE
jgi:hypothetical protein